MTTPRRAANRSEVLVAQVLMTNRTRWLTVGEIVASLPEPVAPRTVRKYTQQLTEQHVVDRTDAAGGNRYRLAETTSESAYLDHINWSAGVLGLDSN